MTTKELLELYYAAVARKAGWESVLSDDFKFVGGDMTNTRPLVGKSAYVEVLKRFSQRFEAMRVKEMFVDGDRACVIANYDYVFPGGQRVSGDVAELWRARDGKLDALTIYFDTLSFQRLTAR